MGVSACGAGGGGNARHGASVVFASGADLQSINPLLTIHPFAKQIERYVLLLTLARYDTALTPQPYLARAWFWSPDRRLLTLRLQPDVHWSDGRPTRARDVAWTLNAARAPSTGYARFEDLQSVLSVVASDDSTVAVRFREQQRSVPDVFTDLAILPAHVFDTIPRARWRQAGWNDQPVGNGPFRFVLHETNQRWVFAADPRFPRALGGPPSVDRFIVVVVDEPATKLAALVGGELDFAGIQPAHAAFVRRDPDLQVLEYPMLLPFVIVFNLRQPPFNELRVRRAVDLAIDRRKIVDGYLFGFGTPADRPLTDPSAAVRMRVEADSESARELLGDRRVGFELLTVGSGEAPLEQMLQAELARVGFGVTIRQLELTTFLDRVYGSRHDFQAAVLGVQGDLGLGYLRTLARVAGSPLPDDADPALLVRRVRDSLPVAFLYYARGLQGKNRRVEGVRMDVRGELPSITQWLVQR